MRDRCGYRAGRQVRPKGTVLEQESPPFLAVLLRWALTVPAQRACTHRRRRATLDHCPAQRQVKAAANAMKEVIGSRQPPVQVTHIWTANMDCNPTLWPGSPRIAVQLS